MLNSFFSSRSFFYLFPLTIFALFLRWYRLDELLGFQYDQGRDALVIYKLIHESKLFLVGPVTGLEGIFLGPLLYLLLAPFYLLSQGDPLVPAMFLSGIHIFTIFILFFLGKSVNKATAFLSSFIYTFSAPIFGLNRWLSNPPPVMLTSILLIFSLHKITQGKSSYWILASIAISCGLQFEVAAAFYFIPAVVMFAVLFKRFPSLKISFVSILIFLLSLFPQIVFEFRHDFVMSHNIQKHFFSESSFSLPSQNQLAARLSFYHHSFGNKIFADNQFLVNFGFPILFVFSLVTIRLWFNRLAAICLLTMGSQLMPLLIYQGNHGNVYDYHLSANFPIFILLISMFIGYFWTDLYKRAIFIVFLSLFIYSNYAPTLRALSQDIHHPEAVFIGNQLESINWIFSDAQGQPFNIDIYVPPVIPHSYNYLLLWQSSRYNDSPSAKQESLLYTLYEVDPSHPERLNAWLERQNGIAKITSSVQFGGIVVNRRTRF